ncbi:hypothetical protein IFR05_009480 [Cadophora sp. M221]|nr:hypothetical protein IFR05_009480 [Cadophora sp. M221]
MKSSKIELSNHVLGALGYKYNIQFGVYCDEGDPAQEFGVKTRKILTDTSSEQSFQTATTWLEDCILHHPCDQNVFGEENADDPDGNEFMHSHISGEHCRVADRELLDLEDVDVKFSEVASPNHPSRVVDLLPHGHVSIDARLIEITEECGVYAALSYCWGPDSAKDYMLTKAKLPEFNSNIPSEALPRTIQESFQIARRLGVRYIWIDALCIIQDDPNDWQREAAKMGPIYSNAVFTIAANASTSATNGCFNKSSWTRDQLLDNVITIDGVLSDGRKSRLYILRPMEHVEIIKFPQIRDTIEAGTLNSRGWTYQERFLSARILHYSEGQLFWECRHACRAEDGFSPDDYESPYTCHHEEEAVIEKPCPNHGKETLPQNISRLVGSSKWEDNESLLQLWYEDIVPGYTGRSFTHPKDRLAAFAGMARLMSQCIKSHYILGIWSIDFPFGLGWIKTDLSCPNSALGDSPFPSWSWASQCAKLIWTHAERRKDREFTDIKIHSFTPNMSEEECKIHFDSFSAMYGGYLHCAGFVKPVLVVKMTAKYEGSYMLCADDGMGSQLGRVWMDNENWFPVSKNPMEGFLSYRAYPAECVVLFTGDEHRYVVMLIEKTGEETEVVELVGREGENLVLENYRRLGVGEIEYANGGYMRDCMARDLVLV